MTSEYAHLPVIHSSLLPGTRSLLPHSAHATFNTIMTEATPPLTYLDKHISQCTLLADEFFDAIQEMILESSGRGGGGGGVRRQGVGVGVGRGGGGGGKMKLPDVILGRIIEENERIERGIDECTHRRSYSPHSKTLTNKERLKRSVNKHQEAYSRLASVNEKLESETKRIISIVDSLHATSFKLDSVLHEVETEIKWKRGADRRPLDVQMVLALAQRLAPFTSPPHTYNAKDGSSVGGLPVYPPIPSDAQIRQSTLYSSAGTAAAEDLLAKAAAVAHAARARADKMEKDDEDEDADFELWRSAEGEGAMTGGEGAAPMDTLDFLDMDF